MLDETGRFHITMDAIRRRAGRRVMLRISSPSAGGAIDEHRAYVTTYFEEMPEIPTGPGAVAEPLRA